MLKNMVVHRIKGPVTSKPYLLNVGMRRELVFHRKTYTFHRWPLKSNYFCLTLFLIL